MDGIRAHAVDYLEPTAAVNPAVGPLIALDIEHPGCVTLRAIGTVFPEARITVTPRGSRGERGGTFLSIASEGGGRRFGISADEPKCLNNLVFTSKPFP